jgi:hypothetical protein
MSQKITFFLVVLSLFSVLSVVAQHSESKRANIGGPANSRKNSNAVVVGSFKLQVTTAKLADKYEGVQGYFPKSSDDILLIVHIGLSGDVQYDSLKNVWDNCFVIDNTDIKCTIGGKETEYTKGPNDLSNKLSGAIWIFSVRKSSKSFRLILPGSGVIKLDALIASSKKQ